jgi:two-component system chemotaxis response regulator CheY
MKNIDQQDAHAQKEKAQVKSDQPLEAFTCLVADDSRFARKNIAGVVAKLGGNIVGEAKNGVEALALYSELSPDLVLLDITMPQLDGIDTLRSIMERDRNAKVVIISSLGNKEMVWKAIGLGARSFLTKPINADYAALVIGSVVRGGSGGPG